MNTQHRLVIDVQPGADVDLTEQFEHFKKQKGIKFVLGFSGGADDSNGLIKFLGEEVRKASDSNNEISKLIEGAKDAYVASFVDAILLPLRGYRIGVLTGGTKWGVPRIAAESAKKYGFTTIGVFPQKAKAGGDVLSDEVLDLKVCVHPFIGDSKWGDEAAVYTELLDSVIIIGGGAGTMVEVAHLLKMNEKKGRVTKHLMPIYGTGGTADKLSFFPGKPETMARCVPQKPLTSSDDVNAYLKQEVFPADIYD